MEMINLLPETAKKEIRAARANVTLLNYMLILGLGVIFLALVCVGVYFVLIGTRDSAQNLIDTNQSKTTTYSSAQIQGNELRTGLTNAKTILDQEVDYTKLITGIAALMPKGVVLSGLNLSSATFGAPITLQFYATTTQTALNLKTNLQASSLFSAITFQTLASTSGVTAATYPVSASLSLTINKSAVK
jgi:Tfp pilus assembly protein PilN